MHKKSKVKRAVAKPHIKKDDSVVILSGEDAGKKGRVLTVEKAKGMARVEGVNMIKRHQKANKKIGKGGIVTREGTIFIGKIGLVCSSCNKLTSPKIVDLKDETSRICSLCNEPIGRK